MDLLKQIQANANRLVTRAKAAPGELRAMFAPEMHANIKEVMKNAAARGSLDKKQEAKIKEQAIGAALDLNPVSGVVGMIARAPVNPATEAIKKALETKLINKAANFKHPDNIIYDKLENIGYSLGPDGYLRMNVVPDKLLRQYQIADGLKEYATDPASWAGSASRVGLREQLDKLRHKLPNNANIGVTAYPQGYYAKYADVDGILPQRRIDVNLQDSTEILDAFKAAVHEGSHALNMATQGPAGGNPVREMERIVEKLAAEGSPKLKNIQQGQMATKLGSEDVISAIGFLHKNNLSELQDEMLKTVFKEKVVKGELGNKIHTEALTAPNAFHSFIRNKLLQQPELQQKVTPPVRDLFNTQVQAFNSYQNTIGEVEARLSEALLEKAASAGTTGIYQLNPYKFMDTPVEDIIMQYYPALPK